MADQEQLKRLLQGAEIWNTWRRSHQGHVQIDLNDADLNDTDLSCADLSGADLFGANLSGAHLFCTHFMDAYLMDAHMSKARLSGANLSRAKLSRADLSGANLFGANLSHADLSMANLIGTHLVDVNLSGANLSGANLSGANLSGAKLGGANLIRATVGWTVFCNLDLRDTKGVDALYHRGPSSIGADTLERSQGALSESFLRKAGVHDNLITYARSLFQSPIQFYTCFISYSSQDQAFIERLYADLQSKDVRCWYAPEDLKPGELIRQGIDEAIRRYDKFLLVLSEHAVESAWVGFEVEAAMERERREKRTVLYPIRLDDCVMDTGQAWAADLRRTRHIGDFRCWKEHDAYQERLRRLLQDLQPDSTKTT